MSGIDWSSVWKPKTWRDTARRAVEAKDEAEAVRLLVEAVEEAILAKAPAPRGTAGRLYTAWKKSGRSFDE